MADKHTFDLSDIPVIFNEELSGFHIGGTGIAGSLDDEQRCLASVYNLEGAEQAMLMLCGSTNKAVRLYGLLGLKMVTSDQFQREYEKLANDQDEMFTWSGCMGYPSTVGRLATEISRSDVQWLRDLNSHIAKPAYPNGSRPSRHEETAFPAFSHADLPEELVHKGYNPLSNYEHAPDLAARVADAKREPRTIGDLARRLADQDAQFGTLLVKHAQGVPDGDFRLLKQSLIGAYDSDLTPTGTKRVLHHLLAAMYIETMHMPMSPEDAVLQQHWLQASDESLDSDAP